MMSEVPAAVSADSIRSDGPLAGRSILFLNNFSGAGLGGGEVHMRQVILGARDAGADVHLLCQAESDVERAFRDLGVAVTGSTIGWRTLGAVARQTAQLADDLGADIIHSNGYLTNVISRRAKRPGGPLVVNSVLVDPDAPRLAGASRAEQILRNVADKQTIGKADAFAPITQAVAAKLESLGVSGEKITVIPGSVDVAAIESEAQSSPPGFDRLTGAPVVGMVGRLEQVKGAEEFIEMAALVAAERTDVQFVLGGAGSLESDLRVKIAAHGLGDRVQLPGKVESAAATFLACDIVVVPSRSEGFGIVSAEAMTLSKPVVAARVGGIPEVVEDGVTGILVPAVNPQALADAVLTLLDDPVRVREMGTAGRLRVEQHFTIERMQRQYVDLYEKLLAGVPGSARRDS